MFNFVCHSYAVLSVMERETVELPKRKAELMLMDVCFRLALVKEVETGDPIRVNIVGM